MGEISGRRVLAALVAATIAGTLLVALPSVTGAFPGIEGKIVYAGPVSNGDFRSAIYTIDPSGQSKQKLIELTGPPGVVFPTWSPDASEIAFTSTAPDAPGGESNVYALNVETNEVRLLAHEPGFDFTNPAWSPNGTQLTFNGAHKPTGERRIWIVDSAGTDWHHISEPLSGGEKAGNPVFSMSGVNSIIYTDGGAPGDLFSMNPDGSNITRLTTTSDAWEIHPAPSPDGAKMAVAHSGLGFVKIYIDNVLLSQGPQTREDWAPTWSPAGTKIAYQAGTSEPQLAVRNVSGGDETVLTTAGTAYTPDWGIGTAAPTPSPSASSSPCAGWPVLGIPPPALGRIVFQGPNPKNSNAEPLYTIDPASAPQGKLLTGGGMSDHGTMPQWSPNGAQVAYTTYGRNGEAIYVIKADGTNRRRLLDPIYGDYDPTWSPDGRYIAFVRADKEKLQGRVYRMKADGSQVTQLSKTPIQGGDLAWSPNGQQIAYVDKGDIWAMSTAGCGSPENLTQTSGVIETEPDWHPRLPIIAFTRKDASSTKVYTMYADGSNLTQLTHGVGRIDSSPSWSPLGDQMVFRAGGELFVVAEDGRGEEQITDSGSGYKTPVSFPDWGSYVTPELPPETQIVDAPPAAPAVWNSSTVFFTYTSNKPQATFQCRLDGGEFVSCPAEGQYYFDVANGPHTFQVKATDALGNVDESPAVWKFNVKDTVTPNTAISAGPSSDEVVRVDSVTIDYNSNKAASTFVCTLDGGPRACSGATQGAGTVGSITLEGLSNGPHTFSVTAVDAAGNADPTPATLTFTVEVFTCEAEPLRLLESEIELAAPCLKREVIDGRIVYGSEGSVEFNGLSIEAPKIYFDPGSLRLWSEKGVQIWLGDVGSGMRVYDAPDGWIDWNLSFPQINLPASSDLSFEGLPIQGNISFIRDGFGMRADMWAKLPDQMGGVTGELSLTANNTDGLIVNDARIDLPRFKLGGFLEVSGPAAGPAFIEYKGGGDWEGAAKVVLPGGLGADGTVLVKDGQLNGGEVNVPLGDSGIPLTAGVFLDEIGARIVVGPPLELGGTMGIGVGPKVAGVRAVKVRGELTFVFPFEAEPGVFEIEGELFLVGQRVASGFVHYFTNGNVLFGAEANLKFPNNDDWRIRLEADLDGWVSKSKFSAKAGGDFEWRDKNWFTGQWETKFRTTVYVVVSSKGAAGCASLTFGPLSGEVGGSYEWSSGNIKFGGCGLDEFVLEPPSRLAVAARALRVENARVQLADRQTFVVEKGQELVGFSLTGNGAPPEVTITGPDGRVLTTPDSQTEEGPQEGEGYWVQRDPTDNTTYFAVVAPAAGEWVATLKPDSPAVTGISQAAGLPDVEVEADVTGTGWARKLNYKLRPIPGQSVTFSEEADGISQVIGTTNERSGSFNFSPAYAAGGTRKIVALVEQNGIPRDSIEVATYEASDLPDLSRPTDLRAARGKGGLTVSWTPPVAPGISGYDVRVDLDNGSSQLLTTSEARVRLEGVGNTGGVVTVAAVDELGRVGPAASAMVAPVYPSSTGSGRITLTPRSAKKTLRATGILTPPDPGNSIELTLFRKTNGKFVKVASKSAVLGAAGDTNSDGIEESRFTAAFARPGAGDCKLRAFYRGNDLNLPLAVVKIFKC